MSTVSARNYRVAATVSVLFLAVAMHHHVAGAGAVAAPVHHHVVGGDHGWDVASDVLAWSEHMLFTVGDTLWFAYSAADGGVAEVGGEAEFDSCEVGDHIRMYTEVLSRVGLGGEGSRYFVSADPAKCKSRLKLRVDVRAPVPGASPRVEAAAPAPWASRGTQGVVSLMRVLFSLICVWCFLSLGI